MRILSLTGLVVIAGFLVQCKPRQFNDNSAVKESVTNTSGQVDPKYFNAFDMWEKGDQSGSLRDTYPTDYKLMEGSRSSDNIFYVAYKEFIPNPNSFFGGKPTVGARVEGPVLGEPKKKAAKAEGVLIYPEKNGRTLRLKFSALSERGMYHDEARDFSAPEKGLRLPTARELLDFCTAGLTPNKEGKSEQHRCGFLDSTWTASVLADSISSAWVFNGYIYELGQTDRENPVNVRCVVVK